MIREIAIGVTLIPFVICVGMGIHVLGAVRMLKQIGIMCVCLALAAIWVLSVIIAIDGHL